MQFNPDMAAARSILTEALASLIAPARPEDRSLRVVIHGAIVNAPPPPGSRISVCLSVFLVEDFMGSEGHERDLYADATTNDSGQFTAAVLIPPRWRSITSSEVNLGDTYWTGNVPSLTEPHRDDATGKQTADLVIAYD